MLYRIPKEAGKTGKVRMERYIIRKMETERVERSWL